MQLYMLFPGLNENNIFLLILISITLYKYNIIEINNKLR